MMRMARGRPMPAANGVACAARQGDLPVYLRAVGTVIAIFGFAVSRE